MKGILDRRMFEKTLANADLRAPGDTQEILAFQAGLPWAIQEMQYEYCPIVKEVMGAHESLLPFFPQDFLMEPAYEVVRRAASKYRPGHDPVFPDFLRKFTFDELMEKAAAGPDPACPQPARWTQGLAPHLIAPIFSSDH